MPRTGFASSDMFLEDRMKLLVTLSALAFAGLSQAALFTYTFASDTNSFGEEGDPSNVLASVNLGAGSVVTGLAWNVNLTANDPSWLSEIAVSFRGNTAAPELYLRPGFEVEDPGVNQNFNSGGVQSILGVVPAGITTDASGNINLEFLEFFDDSSVAPDGKWHAGSTLTLEYTAVPEPATMAALGLGAAALLRRRRK